MLPESAIVRKEKHNFPSVSGRLQKWMVWPKIVSRTGNCVTCGARCVAEAPLDVDSLWAVPPFRSV